MDDEYADTPVRDSEAMPEGTGAVPCVHVFQMPDGSYGVQRTEEAPPEGLETVGSMDEAMERASQMMQSGETDSMDSMGAMDSMRNGYAKRATPPMQAPSPGALFGE